MQTVLMVFSQRLLHSFVHQGRNVYCILIVSLTVFEVFPNLKKRLHDPAHAHVDLILHFC